MQNKNYYFIFATLIINNLQNHFLMAAATSKKELQTAIETNYSLIQLLLIPMREEGYGSGKRKQY